MSNFSVKTANMKTVVNDLTSESGSVSRYSGEIYQVSNGLLPTLAYSMNVQRRLQAAADDCEDYSLVLNKLGVHMEQIIQLYLKTERLIVDNAKVQGTVIQNGTVPNGSYPSLPSDKELIESEEDVMPSEEDFVFWDYILRSLEQIFLGNFTDESTFLGIVGSVLVGLIPVVGQLADIRDIAGDIYNLVDDGAETEEIISFVVDLVALIPFCDLLKYGDEVLGLTKYLDDVADAMPRVADITKGLWKKGEDLISKWDDLADKGGKYLEDIGNKIYDELSENAQKATDLIKKGLDYEIGGEDIGGIIKGIAEEYFGVEDKIIEGAANAIDFIGEGFTTGIENVQDSWNSFFGEPYLVGV